MIVQFEVQGRNRTELVNAAIKELNGFVTLPCNGYGYESRRDFVDHNITARPIPVEDSDCGYSVTGMWAGYINIEL